MAPMFLVGNVTDDLVEIDGVHEVTPHVVLVAPLQFVVSQVGPYPPASGKASGQDSGPAVAVGVVELVGADD
jgi:hypothetical protein